MEALQSGKTLALINWGHQQRGAHSDSQSEVTSLHQLCWVANLAFNVFNVLSVSRPFILWKDSFRVRLSIISEAGRPNNLLEIEIEKIHYNFYLLLPGWEPLRVTMYFLFICSLKTSPAVMICRGAIIWRLASAHVYCGQIQGHIYWLVHCCIWEEWRLRIMSSM